MGEKSPLGPYFPSTTPSTWKELRRCIFFAVLTTAGRRRLREARPTHNDVIRARLTDRLTASQLRVLGRIWGDVLHE